MTKANLTLSYTDGRSSTIGIAAVNEVLRAVGVRASQTPVPAEAYPILEASKTRAISEDEQAELISKFSLDRNGLLAQIQLAGRTPEVRDGGNLNTSEHNVAPYPKVYDMQAMDEAGRKFVLGRFGRLHVNTADEGGVGIDEVMTVVSGGPMMWFFRLPDGVIVKLSVPAVEIGDQAWRLSYPGKRPTARSWTRSMASLWRTHTAPRNSSYATSPRAPKAQRRWAPIRGLTLAATRPGCSTTSRHELIVHLVNRATGALRAARDSQLSDQPWLPETSNFETPCFAFHRLITARLGEAG